MLANQSCSASKAISSQNRRFQIRNSGPVCHTRPSCCTARLTAGFNQEVWRQQFKDFPLETFSNHLNFTILQREGKNLELFPLANSFLMAAVFTCTIQAHAKLTQCFFYFSQYTFHHTQPVVFPTKAQGFFLGKSSGLCTPKRSLFLLPFVRGFML